VSSHHKKFDLWCKRDWSSWKTQLKPWPWQSSNQIS